MEKFLYKNLLALIIILFTASHLNAQNFISDTLNEKGLKRFRVVKVHDGDTVSIRLSSFAGIPYRTERVRLIGIDAPEIEQEPWGRKAKRHLKKLLSESDWVVRIELDVEKRDKYGRLLVYLWDKKGRLINERMIEGGYAVLYTIPPNVKHAEAFISAQKKAQSKKVGIWKKNGLKMSPKRWRDENL